MSALKFLLSDEKVFHFLEPFKVASEKPGQILSMSHFSCSYLLVWKLNKTDHLL